MLCNLNMMFSFDLKMSYPGPDTLFLGIRPPHGFIQGWHYIYFCQLPIRVARDIDGRVRQVLRAHRKSNWLPCFSI